MVEDEGVIAEDTRTSLSDLGYEVAAVASSGEEAILKAEQTRPNLVLMDVMLKGEMDGIEAANTITERFHIPIVYLTSYADNGILKRAKVSEPFGYLVKPFRTRELAATIEMALAKSRLHALLRENHEWFSVMLNSIADGLIATDEFDNVKLMNKVAQKLTGWTEEHANGKPLSEILILTDLKQPNKVMDAAQTAKDLSNSTSDIQFYLSPQQGPRIIVECEGSQILDSGRGYLGVVLVIRNITQKKEVEEKLRLLSEVIQQSSEGIAVFDMDHKTIFANEAFSVMHGYSREEAVGKHVSHFHKREQMPKVRAAFGRLNNGNHYSGENWHTRKDGTVFPGLMHISLLQDDKPSPVGIIAVLRDITDITASRQALKASHRELEVYSSSLEQMVNERTQDLEQSKIELKKYSESLEKTNSALKMIIEGVEEQKKEIEKRLSQNLNLTIRPIIDQLKNQTLPDTAHFLLRSLDFNLNNIFSSFGLKIVNNGHLLTPREIRVSEMIRSGLSSKQIAEIMGISPQTVLVHRKNIRKKLNLCKSGQNLASFLKTNL